MPDEIELGFGSLRLCGRKQEIKALREAYDRARDTKATSVVLQGAPGCGKSALIDEFLGSVATSAIVGRACFEEARDALEPFLAITEAVSDIIAELPATDQVEIGDFRMCLKATSGEGGILPSMRNFIDLSSLSDDELKRDIENFEQLRVGVRSLVRGVSGSLAQPVVLILDDLQWADAESLSVLKSLVQNIENKNFMFIGSCRPVEDRKHPLTATLKELKSDGLSVYELSELEAGGVGEIVQGLLRRDAEEVKPLVDVIYRKTGGNPLSSILFLRTAESRKLIYFSASSLRWEWDMERILLETQLSDNVLDMVADNIDRLPSDLRAVLINSSCFGVSKFDVNLLYHTMVPITEANESDSDFDVDDCCRYDSPAALRSSLIRIADHGLIDEVGDGEFRFAHNRIREAAYMLMPQGSARKKIHRNLGKKCAEYLSDESRTMTRDDSTRDRILLKAVSQYNMGADLVAGDGEKRQLADLNLRAARIAMRKGAYRRAVESFEQVLDCLGPRMWDTGNDNASEIFNELAWGYFCCGRTDDCLRIAQEIAEHTQNDEERRAAQKTRVRCLLLRGLYEEALLIVLAELDSLGCHVPRNRLNVNLMRNRMRAERLLKDKSDGDLLQLPHNREPIVQEVDDFMQLFEDIGEGLAKTEYMSFVHLRSIQIALSPLGMTRGFPRALANWGLCRAREREFNEASRFGNLAIKLVKRQKNAEDKDMRAVIYAYAYAKVWSDPYREILDPILESTERHVEQGNVDGIVYCRYYVGVYIASGLQLAPLEKDIKKLIKRCEVHGQQFSKSFLQPLHQLVVNLTAEDESKRFLPTVAVQARQDRRGSMQRRNSAEHRRTKSLKIMEWAYFSRLIICYIFCDYELAKEMSKRLWDIGVDQPGVFETLREFFRGMVYLTLAKLGGKHGHRRNGSEYVKMFEHWVEKGARNCYPMLLLMKAEQAANGGNPDEVRTQFDKAIVAAAKLGYQHIHAIGNELAGIYFARRGDGIWAASYLSRAREHYFQWGAIAKVRQMERLYSKYPLDDSLHLQGSLQAKCRVKGDRQKLAEAKYQ